MSEQTKLFRTWMDYFIVPLLALWLAGPFILVFTDKVLAAAVYSICQAPILLLLAFTRRESETSTLGDAEGTE